MPGKFSVLVLISGRGSNLSALLRSQKDFAVSAVLSDKGAALGLKLAEEAGVPVVERLERTSYPTRFQHKEAIYARVRSLNPDLICLAGFMQLLEPGFVEEFYGRLVNIHPSLLPDLPGLDTHSRALSERRTEHGCSVHFVDAGMDTGPIIAKSKCAVLSDDTEERLAARVLALEHKIYPWVVQKIAQKKIWLQRDKNLSGRGLVQKAPELMAEANDLGFFINL